MTMLARCSFTLSLVLLSGCAKEPPAPVTPEPPPSASAPSAKSVMRIEANGVGPIHLGMTGAEVEALPEVTVVPSELFLEGERTPTLRVTRDGEPLATVELANNRVTRIRVESQEAATARGAKVGMKARALEELYGRGRVLTGEGNVCALFKEEPGVSFCFRTDDATISDWARLAEENPAVGRIFVVGT